MSDLFVGLDLGTSAVKVGLFDVEGNLLRRARRTYPLHTPRPGWAEQEPEEWWAATCDALREALAGGVAPRVAAVGLSGQAPSQVLVAASGIRRRIVGIALFLGVTVNEVEDAVDTGIGTGDERRPGDRALWWCGRSQSSIAARTAHAVEVG